MMASVDENRCPLCGETNLCENIAAKALQSNCWCSDKTITFPQALLEKLPAGLKNKSCICKKCVLEFNAKELG